MIQNQAYLFLIFTIDGIIISLLFDFFRIIRKSFKTADLVTYIEDILFWILTGFLILYSIFIFNNGEIRFFMFIGIAIGVALYMLLLSRYIIKINVYIISIFKKIIRKLFMILIIPLKIIKKILLKPIIFIIINFKNLTKNAKKIYKKTKNREDFENKSRII